LDILAKLLAAWFPDVIFALVGAYFDFEGANMSYS